MGFFLVFSSSASFSILRRAQYFYPSITRMSLLERVFFYSSTSIHGSVLFSIRFFAFSVSVSGFVGFSHSRPHGWSVEERGGLAGGAEIEERAFNDL
jgi:hypothetical protein